MKSLFKRWQQRFDPLAKLEKQRIELCAQHQCPPALLPLFTAAYPHADTDLKSLSYLVIDFETTGLNPMIDHILSVASIPIDDFCLKLSESRHDFVAQQQIKQDTAVINHIVPQMLQSAVSLDQVMTQLFTQMQGRIVIAHGSNIEKRFIQHYLAMKYKLQSFPLLWLDTLKLERTFVVTQPQQAYQLGRVRRHYGLPEYINHNALIDAIAAGELFLAQIIRLFGSQKQTLGEVYKRSL
ncbi:exonuclease domain-containing protein [Testudinibacter aquarius]|uniref:3'-5' exonuclease n=1 Tax=Testudinibacter aquarius TaxID=1524974 RepID=A0A4R3Y3G6_9PAST|nr:exonuclease domain-containing protein [Testudinibacter aquarius]KAE9527628.1 DNA polymerase III subunit epsilon [Testudinibacter aquarius]TCV84653.1 DNA polymerase-3 subunit epsilon [Testudinibacter aquarius]TNG92313.1 3'-5' exonuclease [Testudinibacter aquarius]